MKKIVLSVCCILLSLCLLAGCGETATHNGALSVTLKGQTVALGDTLTDTLSAALGTPTNTTEAVSCHYEGMDTIYEYDGFTLYTYQKEGAQILYSVELLDAAYKTAEGAAVGMSKSEVQALYPELSCEELANSLCYTYPNGQQLFFHFSDDAVSCIEYYTE